MQFTANGPDIPVELLQAHEDGKLVFFCGAGVSYPAGLPGFEELIKELEKAAHAPLSAEENKLIEAGQIDQAIGRYENRIQGGRDYIRSHLPAILGPDPLKLGLKRPHALSTHRAILRLAKNSQKIITTNFDTLFETASGSHQQNLTVFPEPPTRSQWDGIVYLHGRMPDRPSKDDLDRLILSDSDFGRAYLTEGRTAQFLTGVFQEFVVCFVGYSINDPILRYMTAAHALNNKKNNIFAFAPYETQKKDSVEGEWKNKYVTPILYNEAKSHQQLRHTLITWASITQHKINGKKHLIARNVHKSPQTNTLHNNFVGRVLWALADPSGLPAKRFAQLNPVPSLEWLPTLFPGKGADKTGHSIPDPRTAPEHPIAIEITQWLLRHMDDPKLLGWLLEQGSQINQGWRFWIEHNLDEYARLAHEEGHADELAHIKAEAPNAIPSPPMRLLWRLLLGGRLVRIGYRAPEKSAFHFMCWKQNLNQEGLTTTLRLQLREMLTPQIALTIPDPNPLINSRMKWELVLPTEADVRFSLGIRKSESWTEILPSESWMAVLPKLFDDFQQLLRDALDILCELGKPDSSCASLRSISPHEQNRHWHRDWVVLIELLRDAWLAVHRLDSARATQIALGWFAQPQLTFQRLALFAASQPGVMAAEQWAQGMLAHGAQSLWSSKTKREVMRLLVLQGSQLAGAAQTGLETAIMAGPPREAWSHHMDAAHWQAWQDRSIWLRLAKLGSSGLALGAPAAARLVELSTAYPESRLVLNEREEFPPYMGSGLGPNHKHEPHIAPRRRSELAQWLKQRPAYQDNWRYITYWDYEDNWKDICRTRFFHSLAALADLDCEQRWPITQWQQALQVWSQKRITLRFWRCAAPLVAKLPDEVLGELCQSLGVWLIKVAESRNEHRTVLLDLCQRILALTPPRDTDKQPNDDWGFSSLNHPVGHVTRALLNLWFKHRADNQEPLADDVQALLSQVCRASTPHFIHGRAMLARYSAKLFDAASHWTRQHLLPWFDWAANPVEAQAVWQGFFRSSSDTPSLMLALKPHFLACVQHYDELGNQRQQFVTFLTHLALHLPDVYSQKEWGMAFAALPQEALAQSINCIAHWLDANQAKENYWENRIKPFWENIYPKDKGKFNANIANSLAKICITVESKFPIAFKKFEYCLGHTENEDHCISTVTLEDLKNSDLCQRFPEVTVQFLEKTINTKKPNYDYRDLLKQCLDKIQKSNPKLTENSQFIKLRNYTESS